MSKELQLNHESLERTKRTKQPRVLLAGGIGTGKTMQFATLPGRKFYYVFDSNALETLLLAKDHGAKDIDYVEFLPDLEDIDIAVQTLKKDVRDRATLERISDKKRKPEPKTYIRWEEDFEKRLDTKFFEGYDWVGFDSYTSWADMVYDRIMFLNKRLGKQPEQADHAAQMQVAKNVFRLLTAQGVKIFCTAHIENYKDELTGAVHGRIMMTGRNRIRIPGMFSLIYATRTRLGEGTKVTEKSNAQYLFQTVPDREFPVVRNTIPELDALEDVTIDLSKPIQGQGLASILERGKGYILEPIEK